MSTLTAGGGVASEPAGAGVTPVGAALEAEGAAVADALADGAGAAAAPFRSCAPAASEYAAVATPKRSPAVTRRRMTKSLPRKACWEKSVVKRERGAT